MGERVELIHETGKETTVKRRTCVVTIGTELRRDEQEGRRTLRDLEPYNQSKSSKNKDKTTVKESFRDIYRSLIPSSDETHLEGI